MKHFTNRTANVVEHAWTQDHPIKLWRVMDHAARLAATELFLKEALCIWTTP